MSGQWTEHIHKTFAGPASAINQWTRVKLTAGVLVAAGLTDAGIGVVTRRIEIDVPGDVLLHRGGGTRPMIASLAISAGDSIYTAASGKVSNVQGVDSYLLGTALESASGDGAVLEVLCCDPVRPIARGTYTMVAGDDSAGTKDIATGLNNIASFQVEVVTAAGVVTGADMVKSATAGNITIADGSSYKLTAGHIARWAAFA